MNRIKLNKALVWLQRIESEANALADTLDPKRRADYANNPVLRRIDAIAKLAKEASFEITTAIPAKGTPIGRELLRRIKELS